MLNGFFKHLNIIFLYACIYKWTLFCYSKNPLFPSHTKKNISRMLTLWISGIHHIPTETATRANERPGVDTFPSGKDYACERKMALVITTKIDLTYWHNREIAGMVPKKWDCVGIFSRRPENPPESAKKETDDRPNRYRILCRWHPAIHDSVALPAGETCWQIR